MTLEGKFRQKNVVSVKSYFYILIHVAKKKACYNWIVAERLVIDDSNRNVEKFYKNFYSRKTYKERY